MIERCEWCYGRRIGMNDDLDFDELARLRAENERLKAEIATTDEEWRRLDVEVSHFAKLAEDRAAENERLKADAARLDSGRIALWGPGEFFDAETGRRENVQTEHSGVDLRKAIDEAIEMATPEWRAMYCVP